MNNQSSTAPYTGQSKPHHRHHNKVLLIIAIFKLLKASAVATAGVTAIVFRNADLAKAFRQWVNYFRMDPNNHFINGVIHRLANVHAHQLEMLAVGSFMYAAMFMVEGFGLYFEKPWAEYLVIVNTFLLVPVEVFELIKKPSWVKVLLLAGNLAIVAYLIYLRTQAIRSKVLQRKAAIDQ
ncbi:MAG: DUF2127 domain-containing protein [Phycisphaerales bacterium]|nr:DUF2127 domain-containing protein [Phycisphaerales bacterium]